jgi:hypothetical protein
MPYTSFIKAAVDEIREMGSQGEISSAWDIYNEVLEDYPEEAGELLNVQHCSQCEAEHPHSEGECLICGTFRPQEHTMSEYISQENLEAAGFSDYLKTHIEDFTSAPLESQVKALAKVDPALLFEVLIPNALSALTQDGDDHIEDLIRYLKANSPVGYEYIKGAVSKD